MMQIITEQKATSTVDTYYARLKIFNDYLNETGKKAEEITTKDMMHFKNELLKKGLSDRYINNILSVIRSFYDFLIMTDKRKDFNPVLPALRSRAVYQRPNVLSEQEEQDFLSWASQLQINLYVGFLLMLKGGCRVSEACNLTRSDLALDENGALILTIKGAKWGSDRKVPIMDAKAARIIYNHLSDLDVSSKPITRCSPRTLQTYAQDYKDATGIEISCHTLRHTFATRLLENDVPIEQIRRLMGHKTINMTAHYTQSAKINFKHIAPTIWQAEIAN